MGDLIAVGGGQVPGARMSHGESAICSFIFILKCQTQLVCPTTGPIQPLLWDRSLTGIVRFIKTPLDPSPPRLPWRRRQLPLTRRVPNYGGRLAIYPSPAGPHRCPPVLNRFDSLLRKLTACSGCLSAVRPARPLPELSFPQSFAARLTVTSAFI